MDLLATPPAIEEREGDYFVTQFPITLAALILCFQEGLSPESIRRECFPSLPLSHIYSVVSFYLNNQELVEDYLKQVKQEEEALQRRLLASHPVFIKTAEELHGRDLPNSQK